MNSSYDLAPLMALVLAFLVSKLIRDVFTGRSSVSATNALQVVGGLAVVGLLTGLSFVLARAHHSLGTDWHWRETNPVPLFDVFAAGTLVLVGLVVVVHQASRRHGLNCLLALIGAIVSFALLSEFMSYGADLHGYALWHELMRISRDMIVALAIVWVILTITRVPPARVKLPR